MPGRFSTLLDKKWVHRFVYVNPVAFSKLGRSGRRSSKIFNNSARLRQLFSRKMFAAVAIRCRHNTNWKMRYPEVTIMKGCARVMLERQLRYVHRSCRSMPTGEKNRFLSPVIFVIPK